MYIYPAIDLRGGKAVRLVNGDYDKMTVYSDSPEVVAGSFFAAGATRIHIVDLDGAKDNELSNYDTVTKIIKAVPGMFAEVGGGIRNAERVRGYLDAGASRVIIGSAAVENPDFVGEMCALYGNKIAVGVDASDGFVAIHGWKTVTDKSAADFCGEMKDRGVSTIIYTDISRDGLLSGTNIGVYRELSKLGIDIIASGGITFGYEISELRALGLHGAILGKALYAGRIRLEEAIALGEG